MSQENYSTKDGKKKHTITEKDRYRIEASIFKANATSPYIFVAFSLNNMAVAFTLTPKCS